MGPEQLTEYLANLRGLLDANRAQWGLVVERQVQFKVLTRIRGQRQALEPAMWELLMLCLQGHETPAPTLAEPLFEQAIAAAEAGHGLSAAGKAAYPRAARAVARALLELREVGVLPRPKLSA